MSISSTIHQLFEKIHSFVTFRTKLLLLSFFLPGSGFLGDFRGSGTRNPFLHPQGQQQPQDAGGQLERQENGQGFGDGAPGQLEQPQGPHHADGQHQGLAQRCPQEQGRSLGPGAGEFHVHAIAQGDHRHHRPQDMALEKGDHRQGHADGPGQDPGWVVTISTR